MKKIIFWIICSVLPAGCATQPLNWQSPYRDVASLKEGDILHIPTGTVVNKDQLMEVLDGARIVYVGETHDNTHAHQIQLEILEALFERNSGHVAVGMEMLRRPSQAVADQWASGELEEKAFVRAWINDWTNDFEYYRDILWYVRDRHIPLVALRASEAWTDAVKGKPPEASSSGSDSSGDGDAVAEPLPEMDYEDPYHRAHTEAVFDKHPGHGRDFEDFYRVQVLWDESMAQSVYDFLSSEKGKGRKLIVFAGAQHVEYGFGIPRRVFRRLPVPYAVVVPITMTAPGQKQPKLMGTKPPEVPLVSADFAWVVGYDNLEDEKVRLGVFIDSGEKGVKILGVSSDSSAAKAGLAKEDIITAFDGEPVHTTFDLTYLIGKKRPGDTGVVEVLRGEEPLRFEVTFEASKFHM